MNIAAIKGNIFQYGPLPISVKVKDPIPFTEDMVRAKYSNKPTNGLGQKSWCFRKLQPQYPPWFCNTRQHYSVCRDRTSQCKDELVVDMQ